MTSQPDINTIPKDNRTFLNGKQLAKLLDVSAPSLSEAVKKGRNCQGHPVVEWAVETDTGRIKGYDVPEFLVSGDDQKPEKRSNPSEKVPNEANISPNKGQKPVNQLPNVTHNNYSLLPKGEDYVRPAGMITLPLVLKKALDKDTPQSRAVIGGLLALLGAITGHAVTDNAAGAGVGAGTGFGIAVLMYKYFGPNNKVKAERALDQTTYQNILNKLAKNSPGKSGYLPN